MEVEGKICPLCNQNWVRLHKGKESENQLEMYKCTHGDLFVKQGDSLEVIYSFHNETDKGKIFKISKLQFPKRLRGEK